MNLADLLSIPELDIVDDEVQELETGESPRASSVRNKFERRVSVSAGERHGPVDVEVLGNAPTSLYVQRELRVRGGRTLAVHTAGGAAAMGRFARHARCIEYKRWLSSRRSPSLIAATADDALETLVELAIPMEGTIHGSPDAIETLLEKGRFYAAAQNAGLRVSRMVSVRADHDSDQLTAAVGLPCLLKPTLIHLVKGEMAGKKVLLAGSRDELAEHLAFVRGSASPWLAQEIVPGPESDIWLVAGFMHEGRLEQGFSAIKLRQYPPGFGSASLVESRRNDELLATTEALLRATHYDGIFGAEYKWSADHGYIVIEVNPRPTLWFQITHDAGKRIALHAIARRLGGDLPEDRPQLDGVRWRYLLKDLVSARFYRCRGASFILPPPAIPRREPNSRRSSPVFSWRDPLPVFGELFNYAQKALTRHG